MRRLQLTSLPLVKLGHQHRHQGFFDPNPSENPTNDNYITTVQPDSFLDKTKCVINKQAFGIPFRISDEAAVDGLFRHHQTHVHIHSVERLMMPFWLCTSAVGGSFKSEYYTKDPTATFSNAHRWLNAPTFQYTYPLEEHMTLSQISASYLHPSSYLEEVLCGTHVPSMLLSRYELLDELNQMKKTPTLIPFVMSTETAYFRLDKRITRALVCKYAERELHKHYGSFSNASIRITSMKSDMTAVRPVFLPLYYFTIKTKGMPKVLPAYVCGATGKVAGPKLHVDRRRQVRLMAAAGASVAVGSAFVVEAPLAITAGAVMAISATVAQKAYSAFVCAKKHSQAMLELATSSRRSLTTDAEGYKWTVQSEEQAEYQYREELRNKERRRIEFEKRAKEEADRDDARRTGRMFEGKHRARHDLIHSDRLGYYDCLGLQGRERISTAKDIQTAFRVAVQKHHPDTNIGNEDVAKVAMQQVLAAYGVLRDAKKRKEYDAGGLMEESQ